MIVRTYAERAILEDVVHKEKLPTVNLDASNSSKPNDNDQSAEKIDSKVEMGGYDLFSPEATKVSSVTTVTSETEESATTLAPESEESTTVTTTDATTSKETTTTPPTTTEQTTTPVKVTTTEPTTEATTTEEEEEILDEEEEIPAEDNEEEEEIIEDHEELVTSAPEDEYEQWLISSIIQDINDGKIIIPDTTPEQNTPHPEDNLIPTKSWKNETLTIYERKTGKYVTGNAFDIICGVTFNEVGTSMDEEAVKAQAIAAYSYIKFYESEGEIAKISMKTDVPDEIYEIVEQVDGLCMYYDGQPIRAAFSASTGGYSSSSHNVWGGYVPYLVSVKNDYDYLDTKHYGRVTTYTVDEVREAIEDNTDIKLSDNPENWIRVLENVDTVYAGQMSIDGHTEAYINGKTRKITGYNFRTHVLSIRSTNFTVSYDNGIFTFVTYGYGHGVGMSQIGANLYATYGGYTFDQILHHYYTGIVIK